MQCYVAIETQLQKSLTYANEELITDNLELMYLFRKGTYMCVNNYMTYADATENKIAIAATGAKVTALAEPVAAGVFAEVVPLPPGVVLLLDEPPFEV
jgi:hypothetical protein